MKTKSIVQLNADKLNLWKDGKEVVYLDPNKIEINEPIHMKCKRININKNTVEKLKDKPQLHKSIIVKQLDADRYSLVMGIKNLVVAKELNKPIACIIVKPNTTYNKLSKRIGLDVGLDFKVPEGTELIYPMHKVRVSKAIQSKPGKKKYDLYEQYYKENGCIDKPISVVKNPQDRNGVFVVDGLIRYLILRNNGVKHIPVQFVESLCEEVIIKKI